MAIEFNIIITKGRCLKWQTTIIAMLTIAQTKLIQQIQQTQQIRLLTKLQTILQIMLLTSLLTKLQTSLTTVVDSKTKMGS